MAVRLTWIAAADIVGITPRQMRRLERVYECKGHDGLVDQRGGGPRRRRIRPRDVARICQLRREGYADFSIQHVW